MMTQKQRIDFIDLAKGFCILIIVLGHCNININIIGYNTLAMPAFYILSGMLFKENEDVRTFTIKKVNKLLIPFLFFYLTAYLLFYIIKFFAPQFLITDARGILDLFDNRQFFNGPIWFLLSIFWCNIYFYIICRLILNNTERIIVVFICGTAGWLIGHFGYFLPLFLDVAMTALPFFAFGYCLKNSNFLYPNKWDKYNLWFALVLWIISFVLEMLLFQRVSFHYNHISVNSVITSTISTLSFLYLCRYIKRLPYISYLGKYSIILLCVHHMIYRPVKVLLQTTGIEIINNEYSVAMVTLILSTLCIPICIKYIPWFVAQKDLIRECKR